MKVEIKVVVDIPDDAMQHIGDDLAQTVYDATINNAIVNHIESTAQLAMAFGDNSGNKDYEQLRNYHQTWKNILSEAEFSVEPLQPSNFPKIG